MCGRYTITAPAQQIAARFDAALPTETLLEPRYNAAPSQLLPVIVLGAERRLELFQWGLIPHWSKDPSIGSRLINARAETLQEKPSFREPLRKRRCLVPADGFFEWQRRPGGKLPMRMTLADEQIYAFAGLWDSWKDVSGQIVHSFTIITTEPNDLVAPIHNRMPAILRPEHEALWLDPSAGPQVLTELLRPYQTEDMRAYPVSTLVNMPANDHPDVIAPLSQLGI
jgi:putative SOS response-associated peptidase YedK